ncbi:hypothetical protein B0H14DRAFT_2641003 [Mycena olivaceomarginata]|nr:hypothetical protein B0H14DRAFT_2641003 [Mycena olivaceomarginata]
MRYIIVSKRIAVVNFVLFVGSIASFIWILVYNHSRRASVIAPAIDLRLPGCPTLHSGIEWAQWVPATVYEGILFGFALVKTFESAISSLRKDGTLALHQVLLRDNILYFFGIAALLVFNNSVTHIPWFSYGPFHAAIGIMTSRMLLNLRKATSNELMLNLDSMLLQNDVEGASSETAMSTVPVRGLLPLQLERPSGSMPFKQKLGVEPFHSLMTLSEDYNGV